MEAILSDTNDLTCPGTFIDRVMCDIYIIVLYINLEVLGGIEACHANIIWIKWVTHLYTDKQNRPTKSRLEK